MLKFKVDKSRIFMPASIPLNEKNRSGLRKFLKIEGYERDFLSLIVYRSVHIFADAIRKTGTLNPDSIAETMRTATMDTPLGPFHFSTHGFEADASLEILSLEELERKWNEIESEEDR